MKKSLKLLAAVFAMAMLLTAGATIVSAGDAEPAASYDPYYLLWINSLTPEERIELQSMFLPTIRPSYNGNLVYAPGLAVTQKSITMKQYTGGYLGLSGLGLSYKSNNTTVATVDNYGYVYANKPGEARITVYNGARVVAFVNVTVESDSNVADRLKLSVWAASQTLYVGQSTKLYVRASVNGLTYQDPELEYYISNSKVISFDEDTQTIKALQKGTAKITVAITDTNVETTVHIAVKEDNSWVPPVYDTYYPFYPDYNGYWTVKVPGLGPIYGIYPGMNINWPYIPGFNASKYDFEYKSVFVNGEWTLAVVPVLKEDVKEEAEEEKEPEEPKEPELSKEEKEKLEKEAAEAKRLAELKEKIEKAKDGDLEWYEVYTDIYADTSYYAGVKYVLKKDLILGNDDGTFGKNEVVTYADVADLFCKYLDITKEKLAEKELLPADSDEEELSRVDLAVAFYNLAKDMDIKLKVSKSLDLGTYEDYDDLDRDDRDAFAWAASNYIFDLTTTELDVDADVTKAQLAQAIYRLNRIDD